MAHPRSLQESLDNRFLGRQRVVQRAAWVLMLLVILAALAGFLGTSPLATELVEVEQDGARYELEKPRFTRYQHAERMHLRVEAPAAHGEELKVSFSADFVANNAVTGVTPDADGGGADADGSYYSFKVEDWSAPILLSFAYEPRKAFHAPGDVTVTAGESASARLAADQFVYP